MGPGVGDSLVTWAKNLFSMCFLHHLSLIQQKKVEEQRGRLRITAPRGGGCSKWSKDGRKSGDVFRTED